jgi:predicted PurR-regulated permease PerM
MIHRALVLIALVCSALIVLSFAMFARDQVAGASEHQQQEIAVNAQHIPGVAPIPTHHAQPRHFIDGAASALTSPFRSLIGSSSQWVLRGVSTILALLVYGVGVGYLARFSRGFGSATWHASRAT